MQGSTMGLDWHMGRKIGIVCGVGQPQALGQCRGGAARGDRGLEAGRSLTPGVFRVLFAVRTEWRKRRGCPSLEE